jgi:hypothetical protein
MYTCYHILVAVRVLARAQKYDYHCSRYIHIRLKLQSVSHFAHAEA